MLQQNLFLDFSQANKEDDKIAFVEEGGGPGQLKKYRLALVPNQSDLYQRHFKAESVARLAKHQCILSLFVFAVSLVTTCIYPWPSLLEVIGVGIWAPIISGIGSAILLKTCGDVTYAKLHLALVFEILASLGWLTLIVVGISQSVLHWGNLIYFYNSFDRSLFQLFLARSTPIGMAIAALIITVILYVIGLVQFALSFTMALCSGRAMCQGRSTLEGKLYSLQPIQDDTGAEEDHLDQGGNGGEQKVPSQDDLLPPQGEKSMV